MRLATWNTWWCFGPWEERRPLLRAALARTGADVVLLQETWEDQAAELAHGSGLEVIGLETGTFHPQGVDGSPADHRFGNAVLGRPESTTLLDHLPLTSHPDDGAPRTAVAVRHESAETGPVVAVSTHLCHLHTAGSVRAEQLTAIRAWVDEVADGLPVVLGGDLNQSPTSPEYAEAVAPHWHDLWAEARPGEPGATMSVDNARIRHTAWMAELNEPGAPPGVRLDYLLARRAGAGAEPGPRVSASVMARFGDLLDGWPSDHLGLVAEVTVSNA